MFSIELQNINYSDDEASYYNHSSGYFCVDNKLRPNQNPGDYRTDCYILRNSEVNGKITIGPLYYNNFIFSSDVNFHTISTNPPGKYILEIGSKISVGSVEIESKKLSSGEIWIKVKQLSFLDDDNDTFNGPFCLNYKTICCQPISLFDKIQILLKQ